MLSIPAEGSENNNWGLIGVGWGLLASFNNWGAAEQYLGSWEAAGQQLGGAWAVADQLLGSGSAITWWLRGQLGGGWAVTGDN